MSYREILTFDTPHQGLHEITQSVQEVVERAQVEEGLVHLFVLHTSASLVISENADPSARADLEQYFLRIAPENDPHYTHTAEGPDDMPSHIKAALTHTSETLPLADGKLLLGTWQGLYLFEHRTATHQRKVVVSVMGDDYD